MSQRMVLVIIVLAFAVGIPGIVSAHPTTNLSGSVVSPVNPAASARVVVIATQSGREVGRTEFSPVSGTTTYTFQIAAYGNGPFMVQAYIINNTTDRLILSQSNQVAYTQGVALPLSPQPGNKRLPPTSAGTVLMLVGIVAALLAAAVTVWRRQRANILTPRFA